MLKVRSYLRWAIALIFAVAGSIPARGTEPAAAGRYALLVGCSHYDNLGESFQLQGPANDVLLLRDVLAQRFGFPPAATTILSEAAGGDNRPTRAHIEREFQRLASLAKAGDQVVIFLAGHGSNVPGPDPAAAGKLHMHQIFLPADVGKWDGSKSAVSNSISDDEFHAWISAIRNSGANLWVIIDACHSGGMIRGAGAEVVRQVSPESLVPRDVLERADRQARAAGEQSRGQPDEASGLTAGNDEPGIVAVFAAQSSEVTVEKALPADSAQAKRYGLFNYTICQVLSEATTPLTYAELIQRVQSRYVGSGRTFPTPLVQGKLRDREVLGTRDWPGRSRIVLSADEDGHLNVNAGALQTLGLNTILAVYPPPGQARGDRPLGYVKIVDRQTLTSQVEPCDYQQVHSLRERLPLGGVCEPALVSLGDLQLRVAIDPEDNRGHPAPDGAQSHLREELKKLSSGADSLLMLVDDPRRAQWLVRWDSGKVYLLPAEGIAVGAGKELPPLYGPAAAGENELEWLRQRLTQIARVRNLEQLATSTDDAVRGDSAVRVGLEIRLLKSKTDREGQPLPSDAQPVLHDGDRVLLRLANHNHFPVDVTLLYINGGLGIDSLYPGEGEINRLEPGEVKPLRFRINAKTTGLEHVVVVAVKGTGGQPVEFSALAMPTLEAAQASERTRGASKGPATPLGRLLYQAMFKGGATRGAAPDELDEYRLDLHSWRVAPKAPTP